MLGAHSPGQEARLQEVQRGSPRGRGMRRDSSTPGWFHLHCPSGEGSRGESAQAGGPSSRGGRSSPRMQEPSCQRHFGSPTPEVPGGIWGPQGRRGGRGARPGISGRHRASPCVPGRCGQPDFQRGISPARSRPASRRPSGLRGRGSPGSPRPAPGVPALRPLLTPETWRPGPGRRRSGARGSQLWARGSGDGGRGLGRRGEGGGGGRAARPRGLFSSPWPEEGPGGAAASQVP